MGFLQIGVFCKRVDLAQAGSSTNEATPYSCKGQSIVCQTNLVHMLCLELLEFSTSPKLQALTYLSKFGSTKENTMQFTT